MTAITNAWVYESGALGLRRGEDVHITDRGQGDVRSLIDLINDLPSGWANPDCVWHYQNSGAYGVIQGGEVYFSDKAGVYKLHEAFPSLPNDWVDGITNAWVYESGALGLRRGEDVHITDRGQGDVRSLIDLINDLPSGWANPDCVWHYQNSGAYGVIQGGEVYFSDKAGVQKLHEAFPSLPNGW
ncbi:hypothetical protein ACIQUZ_35285 [Streptomyces griseus]|uniref:hypothetical protein n=1 Tax=Streptomyces TaxID=1883 RepID=UPI002FF17017